MFSRKSFLAVLALSTTLAAPLAAQAQQFFRIGTGGTTGTYYPVGGMIANAVSQPGKIVVTAQATNGSVANVNGIAGGAMESGFSQADVATWAQTGTGIYEGKPNVPGLRLIANLYPESVHVVVKKGSGLKSVADLKGKRVALDEPGSGTLVNARAILAAYGIKEADIKPEYIKPNQASDKLKDGSLDAFFFTGGAPAGAIAELASSGTGIDILPIDGAAAQALQKNSPFFAPDTIPADTYKGVGQVSTLAVGAQWVTSDKADETAVYEITKALFSDAGQKQLSAGHAKGKYITKENAVKSAGIPFHPGAAKFYREAGVLK
ncbi:MAG: TAXI family TRAP transporter solute-binding subunit [Gammaproteobacteria bacterium]|nr:TAXI family TRAP transporter solute-binding subunit [Gammaproteobacteria bacterium]MBU1441665.1 TAXI family TRAP transporter solute-binding subunit [Gammaproteobacteria bacterium]MBU2288017.1 TAXI family TRAP transporter solute-binding subunit [Gammaproteobacteria bacterium]MBU2409047.1 TAXI family TRAP transporter solute-binding subunit [Gammaproteobacteria bacterium]